MIGFHFLNLPAAAKAIGKLLCRTVPVAALYLLTTSVAAALPVSEPASSADSIWPRIANGMRLVDPEQPETVTWARAYAQKPEQLELLLKRSEPFLWFLVEAVELRDLPLEIALVPAIESSFNPNARSPQKARGLWQFLPKTGRAMGLMETRNYDARRDIIESTRAGLTYLQTLYRRFDRDWLLAVAAYNVGPRALAEAIEKAGTNNFWALDLPTETREHVPRLLGLALLIQQPDRFQISLPPIGEGQAASMIALDRPRNIGDAAKKAQISMETIEQYNPGLKNLSDTQGKRWLLLPHDEADRLKEELAQHDYKPHPHSRAQTHVVTSGDSLGRIARRYRVSISDLRKWNHLDPSAVLKPGRRLLVYRSS